VREKVLLGDDAIFKVKTTTLDWYKIKDVRPIAKSYVILYSDNINQYYIGRVEDEKSLMAIAVMTDMQGSIISGGQHGCEYKLYDGEDVWCYATELFQGLLSDDE